VRSRRVLTSIAAAALVLAACSADDADRQVQLQGPVGGDGVAVELAQEEATLDPIAAVQEIEIAADLLEATVATLVDGVAAECAAKSDALNKASADLSERTFIAPQDLACAQLTEASFENARVEGVDFSGANLAGANLRNARLKIVAIGADFTGADLTGADLSGSDLTGAIFTSATLVGSNLTELHASSPELVVEGVGGLAGADLTEAQLGCNQLEMSPLMTMAGVVFDDSCSTVNVDGHSAVTLTGSALGADLTGFDFGRVHLVATDFRGAVMGEAVLSDYGRLPQGMAFVGADLAEADLSDNTFDGAAFVGADLTGADLSASVISYSSFAGADLTSADLSLVESEHNDYRSATVVLTDFTDASLRWDDFAGASFDAPIITGLVIEAVVCDGSDSADTDNGNSVRNFGLCTVGSELIF